MADGFNNTSFTATTFIGAFSGTATNATNVGITNDDSTNATMYPLWVTANTGNLPAKVSSGGLTWNPSTDTLRSEKLSSTELQLTDISTVTVKKVTSLTTTDATPSAIASVAVAEGDCMTVIATVCGVQSSGTDGSNAVGATVQITARRQTGGNVTLVGTEIINVNSSSAATVTADVNTGTQSIRILATGVAATTYKWTMAYEYTRAT